MDATYPFKLPLISGLTTCTGPHIARSAKAIAAPHATNPTSTSTSASASDQHGTESSSPSSPDHTHSDGSLHLHESSSVDELFGSPTPAEPVSEALYTPAHVAHVGHLQEIHNEAECESLAFVRAVIVFGLESVSQSSSSSSNIKGAHRPESATQFLTPFSFKGQQTKAPLTSLPRNASVKGHEWALRDVRTCILGAVEGLPECARPTCFLRHAWRANFTACLRLLCSADQAIHAAASSHGWQLFPKGFSRGDKYLVLKEKRRSCLQQRTAAAAAAAAVAAASPQTCPVRSRATSSGADSMQSMASIYVPQACKPSLQSQQSYIPQSVRAAVSVTASTASSSPTGYSSSSEEVHVPRQSSLPLAVTLTPFDLLSSINAPNERTSSLRAAAVLEPAAMANQLGVEHSSAGSVAAPSPPCVPEGSDLGLSPTSAPQASLPDLWSTSIPTSDAAFMCGPPWSASGMTWVQGDPRNAFPASLLSAYSGYQGWPVGPDASPHVDLAMLSGADLFDVGPAYQPTMTDDWSS